MNELDTEAEAPDAGGLSLEGRVKALEIIVLLMMRDIAKDERKAHNLVAGLRHLARDLKGRGGEDEQIRHLMESRSALMSRLATRFRDEPFE